MIEPWADGIISQSKKPNELTQEYLVQWRLAPHTVPTSKDWGGGGNVNVPTWVPHYDVQGTKALADWEARLADPVILEERTCRVGDYSPGIHAVARTPD